MAEDQEKKEAGPVGGGPGGGPPTPEAEAGGPAPEAEQQTVLPGLGGTAPTGDVVVPFDKINELMKEKGAAKVKAAAEATERGKAQDGPAGREEVKDPDDRDEYEMSSAGLEERRKAEKQQQRRRGRPPKEQAPGKERTGKAPQGKGAGDQGKGAKPERPKKVPAKGGAGKGGPPAPAAEAPAVEPPAPVEVPKPIKDGELVYLRLDEVNPFHTFRPHPFQVKDDAKMMELVESIKDHGVMTPGTARPEKDGSGYECIAGHRRHRGSQLAGAEVMPFIVRHMTDHEAVQEMRDSNKQRDETLPSELARLMDLEMEDIKHQGKSGADKVAPEDVGKSSIEIVARNYDMTVTKAKRFIRLNKLTPELLEMVDQKKLGFIPAADSICHLKRKNQEYLAVAIEGQQPGPTKEQAARMKDLDEKGLLKRIGAWDSIDELNYLASLMNEMDAESLEKFEAAIASGEYVGSIQDLINLTQNLDCYEYLPGVKNDEDLGRYARFEQRGAAAANYSLPGHAGTGCIRCDIHVVHRSADG